MPISPASLIGIASRIQGAKAVALERGASIVIGEARVSHAFIGGLPTDQVSSKSLTVIHFSFKP